MHYKILTLRTVVVINLIDEEDIMSIKKVILIGLFSVAVTNIGLCRNYLKQKPIDKCPEIRNIDIFYIHSFLTFKHNKSKRKDIGIQNYSFDKSEIGTIDEHTPQKLRTYWKTKGIYQISDPDLCLKISNAVEQKNNKIVLSDSYRKIYFKVKNKYIVFYRPKEVTLSEKRYPTQILDNNFRIIKTLE